MIIYANIFFKIKTDESLNPIYSKTTATEFIYENSIIKNIENRINTLILFKRLFFLFSMYVKILPYLNQPYFLLKIYMIVIYIKYMPNSVQSQSKLKPFLYF